MKKIIFSLVLFVLFGCVSSLAQEIRVEYLYNKNGARISRKVIVMPRNLQRQSLEIDSSHDEDKPLITDILEKCKIRIYPNPTKGVLKIEIVPEGNITLPNIGLILYDNLGKTLLRKEYTDISVVLEITDYPTGWYVLELISGNSKKQYKIIKE